MGNRFEYYNPTPAQIKAACKKIQAGWSDKERQARTVGNTKPKRWTPQLIRTFKPEHEFRNPDTRAMDDDE